MWSVAERYLAIKELHEKGWVSLRGAAKILGVSYPTIQRMKRDGRIISTIIGTHRVDEDEILRVAKEMGIPGIEVIGQSFSAELSPATEDDSSDFLVLDAWQEEY